MGILEDASEALEKLRDDVEDMKIAQREIADSIDSLTGRISSLSDDLTGSMYGSGGASLEDIVSVLKDILLHLESN